VQLNTNFYEILNGNEAAEQAIDFDGEDGEKIECYICNKSFPNEDHLIRHQRNAHKVSNWKLDINYLKISSRFLANDIVNAKRKISKFFFIAV